MGQLLSDEQAIGPKGWISYEAMHVLEVEAPRSWEPRVIRCDGSICHKSFFWRAPSSKIDQNNKKVTTSLSHKQYLQFLRSQIACFLSPFERERLGCECPWGAKRTTVTPVAVKPAPKRPKKAWYWHPMTSYDLWSFSIFFLPRVSRKSWVLKTFFFSRGFSRACCSEDWLGYMSGWSWDLGGALLALPVKFLCFFLMAKIWFLGGLMEIDVHWTRLVCFDDKTGWFGLLRLRPGWKAFVSKVNLLVMMTSTKMYCIPPRSLVAPSVAMAQHLQPAAHQKTFHFCQVEDKDVTKVGERGKEVFPS